MSDPVWRKRVNNKLDEIDFLSREIKKVNAAVDILKKEIAELKVVSQGILDKIKESRKWPKKTRSKQYPAGSMRCGKKS